MSTFLKKSSLILVGSAMLLTACGQSEGSGTSSVQPAATQTASPSPAAQAMTMGAAADFIKSYKEILEELGKEKADFSKVQTIYNERVKKLAGTRDADTEAQLASAILAGKEGSLKQDVVKQLFDKLSQKLLFLSIRAEFKSLETAFDDKTKAKSFADEAKVYYGALKTTVEKRDTAYQTHMVTAIDGAFSDVTKSIDAGNKLDFLLAKQVIDKTIMKTFYLAAGGSKGYAYKIEQAVKDGKEPKVEQAEGWAFYQSLYAYLVKSAKEDADWILNKFDLKSNPADIKGDQVKQAFVRSFAAVAKSEYKESVENWGTDKSAITALEGALFIQLLDEDLTKWLGEAEAKALIEKSSNLFTAVKEKDKAKADPLFAEVNASLDKLTKAGK